MVTVRVSNTSGMSGNTFDANNWSIICTESSWFGKTSHKWPSAFFSFTFGRLVCYQMHPAAADTCRLADERVNVRVAEVLTSAFPRRCFVAWWHSAVELELDDLHEATCKKTKQICPQHVKGWTEKDCKPRAVTHLNTNLIGPIRKTSDPMSNIMLQLQQRRG